MAKDSNKLPNNADNGGKEKKAKNKTNAVTMAEKTARQKKKQLTTQKQKREKGRIREYFKGVRLEMKKVVWPTKSELWAYTGVVVAACVFFAVAFWAIDSGVLAALKGLLGITM